MPTKIQRIQQVRPFTWKMQRSFVKLVLFKKQVGNEPDQQQVKSNHPPYFYNKDQNKCYGDPENGKQVKFSLMRGFVIQNELLYQALQQHSSERRLATHRQYGLPVRNNAGR